MNAQGTVTPRRSIDRWREEFPILERGIYLASNCLGAAPRGLVEALDRYAREQFTHGDGGWSVWCPWLLRTADRIARLIGAPAGTVTLDSSVTNLQHRIASCLDFRSARRRVVMSDLDFPSVRYAWEGWSRHGAECVVVKSDDGVTVPTERLLEAIDEQTCAVAVSLATYCSGAVLDVSAVAERAHDVGALVVVDAFQAFGVVPIDVIALDVDILVSGTRKFAMGCGESAFLYVRQGLIGDLKPMMVGWFAHSEPFAFEDGLRLAEGIARFQMGTPLVLPHYAASVGLSILEEVGIETIRTRSLALTDRVIAQADDLGLEVATPRRHSERAGVVCLQFAGAERVAEALNAKHYACSYRPGSGIRVAPHFYNTADEIDRFIHELAQLEEQS